LVGYSGAKRANVNGLQRIRHGRSGWLGDGCGKIIFNSREGHVDANNFDVDTVCASISRVAGPLQIQDAAGKCLAVQGWHRHGRTRFSFLRKRKRKKQYCKNGFPEKGIDSGSEFHSRIVCLLTDAKIAKRLH
jgi:hypothetical protein